ncbi:AraC family transcriptional regulator [Paraburkholderia sp. J7]|uniref:AraC family transcriptional regulator n=1 Tax=Paraburkholderia sp. J7 TaxID=2805438 RepID=UPI002AB7963C|nr:AraC family transcriptional regulator [Paraburkholderia sp. J7]
MKHAWSSYAQFHQMSEYGRFAQEHRRSVGRIPFQMLTVESCPHNFVDPELGETLLALPLTVERGCNWTWHINGRSVTQRVSVGRMLVVPPDLQSAWEVDGARTMLTLCIPNASFRSILGDLSAKAIRTALWDISSDTWEDEFVEGAMKQLWTCCTGDQFLDAHLSDGIITAIVANLLKRAGGVDSAAAPVSMPAWRMRQLRSFVESHLSENINVEDLAGAAGLSPRQFFRAFREQTGETPHRWLAGIRLEKAKGLLAHSNERLYDIAVSCGFSSQSHLSATFRQVTGMTPSQWRSLGGVTPPK